MNAVAKVIAMPTAVPEADDLPAELLQMRRGLTWREAPPDKPGGKFRKIPEYTIGGPRRGPLGSEEDRKKLSTVREALEVAKRRGQGLGVAILDDAERLTCIDVDKCVGPTGLFIGNAFQKKILEAALRVDAYTELSPSGTGFHVWGRSTNRYDGKANPIGVEVFGKTGFVTMTGRRRGANATATPTLVDITAVVDLAEQVMAASRSSATATATATTTAAMATGSAGDMAVAKAAKGLAPAVRQTVLAAVDATTLADLRSALPALPQEFSDEYDKWIGVGIGLKSLEDTEIGEHVFDLWMEHSARSSSFDPDEATAKWESFKPERSTYRSIFRWAQEAGWVNPRKGQRPAGSADDFDNLDTQSGEPVDLASLVLPLDGTAACADAFAPTIVEDIAPVDEVTLVTGHGGSGKSYIALGLAVDVAAGRPVGPLATSPVKVLFFSAEDSASTLRGRLARLCRARGVDPESLTGKLIIVDASDIDPTLYDPPPPGRRAAPETPLLGALADLVAALDVKLVIVDNASDTFAGDEIRRREVRGFVRGLRQRIARPDRAVLLLAHVNKLAANGKGTAEGYSGSTAWHNSVRSRLGLTVAPDGQDVILEHHKSNLGALAAPIRFRWVGGAPQVVGGCGDVGQDRARDEADKDALVELIAAFDQRGERVTSAFQGPVTAFSTLQGAPGFPAGVDKARAVRLLRELEVEGRLVRTVVQNANRKKREVLEVAPIPQQGGGVEA